MFKILKNLKIKDWILLVISVAVIIGSIYLELLLPDYMTDITVIIQNNPDNINGVLNAGVKMLLCALGGTLLTIVSGFITAYVSSNLSFNIREKLFNHVIDLDSTVVDEISTPSLITRTTNDISQIQMFMSMGLTMLIKSPILAIWAIGKIVNKSVELSIATGIAVVLIVLVISIIMLIVLPRIKKVQKLNDEVNRVARENLSGIKVVKAFNAEDYKKEKFDKINTTLVDTQKFNRTAFSFLSPTLSFVMSTLSLVIYWLGAYLVEKAGLLDKVNLFSNIIVFGSYAMYVIQAFMFLTMVFMMFPNAQVSAQRINEVMNKDIKIKEGQVSYKGTNEYILEFNNVSYHYGDGDNVIHNINFNLKKGETLAIIGPTGSGKTTIVNLVNRILEATEGEIKLNGQSIKDYSFDTLFQTIAYVPQKTQLFSGTIKDNITLGSKKLNLSNEKISRALRISQASEFVNTLEKGVETYLSEGGNNLSGGQRQRLSIARALVKESDIIIFDDSFSALDYKTDQTLRKALKEEINGLTCIIVAQRIGTIKNADKILVIDDGFVVGMGTHEELLANCPLYLEIASSQLSMEELTKGGAHHA